MAKPFQYRPRTMEQVRARADQQGSDYVKWLSGKHATFKAPEGENRLRILPATWEGATNYGIDVYVHFNVGPDRIQYLCPKQMGKGDCPVCEAGAPLKEKALEYERAGDKDKAELWRKKASRYKATKKVLMWVIDRKKPEDGPLLFGMPWTLEKNISDRAIDRETRKLLNIDDPEDGYDVFFKRVGTTEITKYSGEEVSRDPTPLSKNPDRMKKWIDFIVRNPIPGEIRHHDYEEIAKAFNAAGKSEEHDDTRDDDAPRGRSRDADDDAPRGRERSSRDDDTDDAPRGRSRARDEDTGGDDDTRPTTRSETRRRSGGDDDAPDPDADDAPRGRSRSRDDDDTPADDDAPAPRRRSRSADADDTPPDDDAPRGRSSRGSSDDDASLDDDPRERRGSRESERRSAVEDEAPPDDEEALPPPRSKPGRKPARADDDDAPQERATTRRPKPRNDDDAPPAEDDIEERPARSSKPAARPAGRKPRPAADDDTPINDD